MNQKAPMPPMWIEKRAGADILVYRDGGCRSATDGEIYFSQHTALCEEQVRAARAEAFSHAREMCEAFKQDTEAGKSRESCLRQLIDYFRVMAEASRAKPEQGGDSNA